MSAWTRVRGSAFALAEAIAAELPTASALDLAMLVVVGCHRITRWSREKDVPRRPAGLAEAGQRLEVVAACVFQVAAAAGKILERKPSGALRPVLLRTASRQRRR